MVAKVWREKGEPLVSWCLVPFSRALIIRIDRASFEAKTCLNSAATGSSAFLSSSCFLSLSLSLSLSSAPRQARRLPFLRVEGCKRQATDLLVRDFYLALDTIVVVVVVGDCARYEDRCHLR